MVEITIHKHIQEKLTEKNDKNLTPNNRISLKGQQECCAVFTQVAISV